MMGWLRDDLIYLASIIDGEGHISISAYQYREKGYALHVGVTNTDIRLMSWLRSTFGGYVAPHKVETGRRAKWTWELTAKESEFLLPQIIPFLKLKKEQAEIALIFRQTFGSKRNVPWDLRQLLYEAIKTLNHHQYPPAETKREDFLYNKGRCDSPNSCGNEPGELAEMTNRLN